MANLYTSGLVEPVADLVDFDTAELAIDHLIKVTVSRYSSSDVYIEDIVPQTVRVENSIVDKTRIRVYLNPGQIAAGEKIKVVIDDS